MTSYQYEELCRHFLAEQMGKPLSEIISIAVPNPTRDRRSAHWHQIDLYWEAWDLLTCYLNIANAKWRKRELVGQQDVMLLQQVRFKVGAHKAIMITNTDFSGQARHVADDEGIGLLIIRPAWDFSKLAPTGPELIRKQIQGLARPGRQLYSYEVVRKGFAAADTALWRVLGMRADPSVVRAPSGPARTPQSLNVGATPVPNKAFVAGAYATYHGPGTGFMRK